MQNLPSLLLKFFFNLINTNLLIRDLEGLWSDYIYIYVCVCGCVGLILKVEDSISLTNPKLLEIFFIFFIGNKI